MDWLLMVRSLFVHLADHVLLSCKSDRLIFMVSSKKCLHYHRLVKGCFSIFRGFSAKFSGSFPRFFPRFFANFRGFSREFSRAFSRAFSADFPADFFIVAWVSRVFREFPASFPLILHPRTITVRDIPRIHIFN